MEASPVPECLLHILQPHLRIHSFNSAGCSNIDPSIVKALHLTAQGKPFATCVFLRVSRGSAAHLIRRRSEAFKGGSAVSVRQQVHQQRVDAVQRLRPLPVPHLPSSGA